ncbi:recombinase family protein [Fibrella forsythiae]|uniref:Recombinase family protein n=1 Tax=Fibrella forsythiae TaxID=2817061 RepID=A0ABS3JT66_9BACT|nr:recombinase family protein [Fibrella forsythiae]MBO0953201.1 recombinase family protein [Fibrella forsythiae]
MNKVFGYARVSALEHNLDTHLNALQRAGCDKIFQDKITGITSFGRITSQNALRRMEKITRI